MNGNPIDDSALDAAIDRAVREMLNAEPRAGLRHRVLARLHDRPTRMLSVPRLAFASALLVALLVILVFSTRRTMPAPTPVVADARPPATIPNLVLPSPTQDERSNRRATVRVQPSRAPAA